MQKHRSPEDEARRRLRGGNPGGKGKGNVRQWQEEGSKAAIESRELYMMIQGGCEGGCLDQREGKVEREEMMEFQSLQTQRNCTTL